MAIIALCRDHAGAAQLRRDVLSAHLAYIETVMDRVAVAGPLRSEAGGPTTGSCFIYDTDDLAEARQLLEADPYYSNGLYAEVSMRHMTAAAGQWIGVKTWKRP